MKTSELREKSEAELKDLLKNGAFSLLEIARNVTLQKEKNTSLLRKKRIQLARIKTVLSEVKIIRRS